MLTDLDVPALPLVALPLHGRLCESCQLSRARVVVSWPDAQFEVCLGCVPAPLLAALTSRTAHDEPVVPWWRRALSRPAAPGPASAHSPAARTVRHG